MLLEVASMTKSFARSRQHRSRRSSFERLEIRTLMAADANLVAYRPNTPFFNYTQHPVADAVETDLKLGPGIRVNGDDDNGNGVKDSQDTKTKAGGDDDLVRVDVLGSGTAFTLTWTTGRMKVWTSPTKTAAIANGGSVEPGASVWVEYVSQTHTTGASATMTLSARDDSIGGTTTATDSVVFHSFRSVVIAIGGNSQDPSGFGDPNLGTFTMAGALYDQGYDVHMFAHDKVSSTGRGAVYDEVTSAVLKRNADNVAIFGYSWGGGATYDLTKALAANTKLKPAGYKLVFTAYVDGIRHNAISSETRLPVGTAYHDNFYQRSDFLLEGNSVAKAHNTNVTNTSWGRSLSHTTIDDSPTLQSLLLGHLITRVVV
jgi:hypothetical protein